MWRCRILKRTVQERTNFRVLHSFWKMKTKFKPWCSYKIVLIKQCICLHSSSKLGFSYVSYLASWAVLLVLIGGVFSAIYIRWMRRTPLHLLLYVAWWKRAMFMVVQVKKNPSWCAHTSPIKIIFCDFFKVWRGMGLCCIQTRLLVVSLDSRISLLAKLWVDFFHSLSYLVTSFYLAKIYYD